MRIALLTADNPLYLPASIDRILRRRAADVVGVFACRPAYGKTGPMTTLKRYTKAFGLLNTLVLIRRVLAGKVNQKLGLGRRTGEFHSVRAAAEHHGVPYERVDDVNDPAFLDRLRAAGTDVVLSVSCPQIFKKDLIDLPALGCLNLHGADLPHYRGLLPSFWMLADGLTTAAVTIFFVAHGIDTGDAAGKRYFPIEPDDTLDSFLIRAKRESSDLALDVLDQIENGTVTRTPLEGEGSYFSFPTREDYRRFRKAGRKVW
ncbi:MAG: methionyl-tRNA formyltransferase [Planctomycetota bacterium]